MFENGILDLSNLDAMSESAEFAPNSYATKDVSNHVQDAKVSIPAGTTMTTQAYEAMLKSFQNSFKEAADFIDALKNVKVVDTDPVEELMENAIDEAIMNVFDNGPVFEAVDRDDKQAVQKIVSKVRKSIKSVLSKNDVSFYEPNKIARILISAGVGALSGAPAGAPGVIGGAVGGAVGKFWSQRLWQIVGVCHIEEANTDALTKILMDEYKDVVGEYKFITVKTVSTLGDLFRQKFGWKNSKNTYFILIDKKLPAEIKKFQDEAAAAIKAGGDEHGVAKDDKKKDDDKKNVNESTDLYQLYLQKFTESGVLGKPLSQEEFVESVLTKLK